MYRLIFSSLLLLGLASFNAQAESCSATKYVEQQCMFDIPEIGDGDNYTATYNGSGLIGGVVAECSDGTVSFEASICKPEKQTDCLIPASVWGGEDEYCSHSSLPGVLGDGVEKVALSDSEMDGRVVYLCEAGTLVTKNSFCNPKILSGQESSIQSGSAVFGITITSCDAAVVVGKVLGNTESSAWSTLCASSGYTTLDKILSSEPYPDRGGDQYYHVEASCSSNVNPDTMCTSYENNTGVTDDFVQELDCNTATVAGVVNSPSDSANMDSLVETALCVGNGYSTLDTLTGVEWIDPAEDTSDGKTYYAEAICSGNSNSSSMCQANNLTHNITALDCDSASITGDIDGVYKSSQSFRPTDGQVQSELCVANGYSKLRNIDAVLFTPSGLKGFYEVTAICESNTAPKENCANSCMGELVSFGSSVPKILGNDGYYYQDLCVSEPQIPDGFCQDCENVDVTFNDAVTGNTCSLVDQSFLTGENKSVVFKNSNFNGEVNVSCNSSQTSVISGSCYKTCEGGSRAVWRDKNGANSCGAVIPLGSYYQNETVSLGTDANNGSSVFRCDDGEWVEQGPSSCKLDCSGSFSWGSGVSDSGVNKNGICRATLGALKDGSSTTNIVSNTPYTDGITSASCDDGTITAYDSSCDLDCSSEVGYWGSGRCSATVPDTDNNATNTVSTPTPLTGYSGAAQFVCGDGRLNLGSASCFQDCPAQNLSVDACSYAVSAAKHGAQAPYSISNSTTEANIGHTCNDGGWVRDPSSYCATGADQYDAWSVWANVGFPYDYGIWSPPQSAYYTDETFLQSRTLKQNQTRTRDIYRTFLPSSRRDFVRTETGTRTLDDSESREVNGTKVRSSLVWVDSGVYNSEYPHDAQAVQVANVPGCTALNAAAAPEVNLGESCLTQGDEGYFAFACNFEDDYCNGQTGSGCGDYFAEGNVAVCGSGASTPTPSQKLSECASVDVTVKYDETGQIETATADYSSCTGSVSLLISTVSLEGNRLDPDGSCALAVVGDSATTDLELPSTWIVNEQYSCEAGVNFKFTRGTETLTIFKELFEDFEEPCQVDTGTNRC